MKWQLTGVRWGGMVCSVSITPGSQGSSRCLTVRVGLHEGCVGVGKVWADWRRLSARAGVQRNRLAHCGELLLSGSASEVDLKCLDCLTPVAEASRHDTAGVCSRKLLDLPDEPSPPQPWSEPSSFRLPPPSLEHYGIRNVSLAVYLALVGWTLAPCSRTPLRGSFLGADALSVPFHRSVQFLTFSLRFRLSYRKLRPVADNAD